MVEHRKETMNNRGQKKIAKAGVSFQSESRMSTSQNTGVSQLDWESFQKSPRVMVGSLEEEKDHRGNVGNMPGKRTNFCLASAHLLWRMICLPLIAPGRPVAGEAEFSHQLLSGNTHGKRRHASVLSFYDS